ncbi:MAG: ATP-binding cassette domain-containing protein [Proteobacteria bacterium]|nr:ATP-binding cassette domain-containing protein [Pseudomonadota bacterium]
MTEKQLLNRVYNEIKPHRALMLIAMFFMALVAGMSAMQAYMVKPLLDKIFFEKNDTLLNYLPLALVAIFLSKGVFLYGYSVLLEKVGQSVILNLRNRLYNHLLILDLSYFHDTPTGELISRIISDVTLLQTAVSHTLIGIIKDSLTVICLLGVIFYQDWKLASFSMVFLPLSILPIIYFGRIHRRLSIQTQQTVARVSNNLHESIGGNRIVKAFCMEQYESNRFMQIIRELYDIYISEAKVKSFSHSFMELLGGVFVAWVIWYGGHQVLAGSSTPGTFFSFLTALVMIYEPIKGLSKMNSSIQQGIASAARVFSILDTEPKIRNHPDAVDIPPMKDRIVFNEVQFSYDNGVQVLNGIDLTVSKGESLAIVGTSGAGKTTLVNMVPRFYDISEGSILVDGADIKKATINSLRKQIAMVSQQTILFNDTIRNNIAYGDLEKSDEDIIEAARAAYALDFIKMMPDGFNTIIGESGARLSGGQQQRISIARALLKNAPILILDEATSALDTESEREVQKALENLMKGRTTFIIAHRLSTIRNADRIIVMQHGNIVEQGSHSELLAADGAYKLLNSMQHENVI